MTPQQNRTRVVYFRVSEDEFREINELCARQGARNLSELVRSAMKKLADNGETSLDGTVAGRLQRLERAIDRMSGTLSTIAGNRGV